jgi:hypothetical protein
LLGKFTEGRGDGDATPGRAGSVMGALTGQFELTMDKPGADW